MRHATLRQRTPMLRIAALAVIVATIAAPVASANGVTCQTSAAAEIAGATVNGPRAGWDPPVWTFDMPDLNMSVDVQDYTHDGAASKAQAWLQGQVDGACAAANPTPAPGDTTPTTTTPTASAPTADNTAAAQTLVNAATVTYVGNSWGPIPIYRVELPSLTLSIDVAANSADEARSDVVPFVAARLAGNATQTATPVNSPTATVPAGGGVVVTGSVAPTTIDAAGATPRAIVGSAVPN